MFTPETNVHDSKTNSHLSAKLKLARNSVLQKIPRHLKKSVVGCCWDCTTNNTEHWPMNDGRWNDEDKGGTKLELVNTRVWSMESAVRPIDSRYRAAANNELFLCSTQDL
ncbi:hypothetical protein KQX54_014370 [Cotesia glomerata]|uniref:Uncharacterized protein n=1 Tax=Cotesia glomerata TaxID=32391 RepID=A0AAV7IGR6_COTGL|nr:hypothetical protein KQX54_014370 [Cotesia glomerata]